MRRDIHQEARGRWYGILSGAGIPESALRNVHGPCPAGCGGKKSFRFDDKDGNGTWICTHCGAGNGMDLLMRHMGAEFGEALTKARELIPKVPVKASNGIASTLDAKVLKQIWNEAMPISAGDPVDLYLTKRGLHMQEYPKHLRFHPQLPYYEDRKVTSYWPAMIAPVQTPQGRAVAIHRTYLTFDGHKAPVASPKKLAGKPGPGAAIRLGDPTNNQLGLTEGIETALAVMRNSHVPVWVSVSAAGMESFAFDKAGAGILHIYADNDRSYVGQKAAYSLAARAAAKGNDAYVHLPDEAGQDWADVYRD